ncbi:MAG: hypothetical protein ACR2N3_04730 [Pyrinomonadaceae bacterium]
MMDSLTHVRNFAKNKEQYQAVKSYILESSKTQNWLPDVDLSLDDKTYGERVKSTVKARLLLEAAFEDIERLLDSKEVKPIINESR